MKYIVTFNVPNHEMINVKVEKEKMQALMEAVNQKKVVQIGDGFYNTAYFATALPDKSEARIDEEMRKRLASTREMYNPISTQLIS